MPRASTRRKSASRQLRAHPHAPCQYTKKICLTPASCTPTCPVPVHEENLPHASFVHTHMPRASTRRKSASRQLRAHPHSPGQYTKKICLTPASCTPTFPGPVHEENLPHASFV